MTDEQKKYYDYEFHARIKAAYGIEHTRFYYDNKHREYHCFFSKNVRLVDQMDATSLMHLLLALNMGQGKVFFDDVNQFCLGLDELKQHYLVFALSGI